MNHIQSKLHVYDDAKFPGLTADTGEIIVLYGNVGGGVRGTNPLQAHANANRLAACWNACEGLLDEELSDGVVSIAKLRQLFDDALEKTPHGDTTDHRNMLVFAQNEVNIKLHDLFAEITGKELATP